MFNNILELFKKFKLVFFCSIFFGILGIIVGYWLMPSKTIIQTQERIIEKQVAVSDRTRTTTEIRKPDGTIETSVTIRDVLTNEIISDTSTTRNEESRSAPPLNPYRPNYSLGVSTQINFNKPFEPSYNFSLGYRILGNMWAGATYYTADRAISFDLRIEF